MTLSVGMVTVDCVGPERLARWWAAAVGGSVLAGLGAAETGRHRLDNGYQWVVMADPDGNAFCVAAPPE